jgi:hypothetical protein
MRSIMAGAIPNAPPATATRFDQLKAFDAQAIARWETLVAPLSAGAPPTLPRGYYDLSMAIDGDFDRQSLSDLRETIRRAVRNHSGWPPFVNLSRAPYTPKPVDGAIECWVGPDNDDLPTTIFGAFLLMVCCSRAVVIRKMAGGKVLRLEHRLTSLLQLGVWEGDPAGPLHQRSTQWNDCQPHSFRELGQTCRQGSRLPREYQPNHV